MDPGLLREARAIVASSEVFDLHVDTFIPIRLFAWNLERRHTRRLLRGFFFGHVDLPRLKDGGVGGALWSITTNPLRTRGGRWRTFQKNLVRFHEVVRATNGAMAIVKNFAEYKAARARGAHAVCLAVQGGNCFDAAPEGVNSVAEKEIVRVTLLHLTNSELGATSAPFSRLRKERGLTPKGFDFVRRANADRVLVDLAHIHPDGFWDAVAVHDRAQPLIVTHTGVSAVTPHWRNLDDRQLKAIADTGGTIGIIFQYSFLSRPGGPRDGRMVVDHLEHVVQQVGEDFASIGSDFDGSIIPPRGLRSVDAMPVLAAFMLERGWKDGRIRKILGENALRVLEAIRPGPTAG